MKIYTLTAFENIKKPDNNKLEKCFEPCQNCKKQLLELERPITSVIMTRVN